MRPMTNSLNIMRAMARKNPEWRGDSRWIKSVRRIRRLQKKNRKVRYDESTMNQMIVNALAPNVVN